MRSDPGECDTQPQLPLEPAALLKPRANVQPPERAAFLASRAQVRATVMELLADQAADVQIIQRCDSCGSSGHGRPSLVDADGVRRGSVSWARSGGYIGVALGGDAFDVAIDVEVRHPDLLELTMQVLTSSERDAVRAVDDAEAAFLRLWTMKECAVKLGLCQLDDFGDFQVELEFGRRGIVWWTDQDLEAVSSGAIATPVESAWRPVAAPCSSTSRPVRHVVVRGVRPEELWAPQALALSVGQDTRSGTVDP